jgi:phosphatidylinositol kinase/protein kinase (PI-3  family)
LIDFISSLLIFVNLGGIYGIFRKTCERVMETLRGNKGAIMAMLEAFVLDPLDSWFGEENEVLDEVELVAKGKNESLKTLSKSEDEKKQIDVSARPRRKKGYYREVDKAALLQSGRAKRILNRVESKVFVSFFGWFHIFF